MAGVAIVNVAPISVSASASISTRFILIFMFILFALARPPRWSYYQLFYSQREASRVAEQNVCQSFHGNRFKKAMEFVAAVDEIASETQLSEGWTYEDIRSSPRIRDGRNDTRREVPFAGARHGGREAMTIQEK